MASGNPARIEEYERKLEKLSQDLVFFKRELERTVDPQQRTNLLQQIRETTTALAETMRQSREAYDAANKNLEMALAVLKKRDEFK
jgi:uncharacterized protein (DUF342 family)